LDLSAARPRRYQDVQYRPDLVVSVCDRAREATLPFAAPQLHWSVPDPVADGRRRAFEEAFAEIAQRVTELARVVES
jgi:protein-tyrosine-phosphatase